MNLDYEVKFAASTFLEMHYDLKGKRLNNHSNLEERIKTVFFNVFPQDGKTYIIFSWLNQDQSFFSELKDQLLNLKPKELINLLNNTIPCYTEHFVINPDLWDSHSEEEKRVFKDIFIQTIAADVEIDLLADTSYDLCKKAY